MVLVVLVRHTMMSRRRWVRHRMAREAAATVSKRPSTLMLTHVLVLHVIAVNLTGLLCGRGIRVSWTISKRKWTWELLSYSTFVNR